MQGTGVKAHCRTVYFDHEPGTVRIVKRLTVIIPSRSQPEQATFLTRALQSIATQTARAELHIDVAVGLDADASAPSIAQTGIPVRWAHASERSQAAALNAAARGVDADYVAFIEDDDQWQPAHLAVALVFLQQARFYSTTQLEIDAAGTIQRINDFPTPSGWVMPRDTWERVGPFDPHYRYHLDSDWLGRLAEAAIPRVHVAEATAPAQVAMALQVRPWLAAVALNGGPHVSLARHASVLPNVLRLVHTGSGMGQIAGDPHKRQASEQEVAQLQARYGRVPW